MSNALTTTNNENTSVAVSGNPFLDAANDMGAGTSALYLKFDGNTGDYSFGKDQEELENGTRVAVAPSEFKNGWICWNDSKVLEEIMVRITEGKPPAKHTLTDHGPYEDAEKDGWSQQSSAQFRDIETGSEYLYKTSSAGGRIALANLVQDYGKAFQRHPGELAIVELSNTSFEAKNRKTGKKLGKKYAPMFKIVGWVKEDELLAKFDAMAAEQNEDEDAEEEELAPPPVNAKSRRSKDF